MQNEQNKPLNCQFQLPLTTLARKRDGLVLQRSGAHSRLLTSSCNIGDLNASTRTYTTYHESTLLLHNSYFNVYNNNIKFRVSRNTAPRHRAHRAHRAEIHAWVLTE